MHAVQQGKTTPLANHGSEERDHESLDTSQALLPAPPRLRPLRLNASRGALRASSHTAMSRIVSLLCSPFAATRRVNHYKPCASILEDGV